jgi:hypothetical protein
MKNELTAVNYVNPLSRFEPQVVKAEINEEVWYMRLKKAVDIGKD